MLIAPNSNDPRSADLLLYQGSTPAEVPVDAPYELEADPAGLFRCWAILMATPGLWYHGEWVPVSEDDLRELVAAQEHLMRLGYEAPLLANHTETEDGRRRGHVGQLEVVQGRTGGELFLLAALTFSDPDAEARKARGEYRYVSAGIGEISNDLGPDPLWGVREVSLVARPWQKRLGPTHLLHEDAMGRKTLKTGEPKLADPKPEDAEKQPEQPQEAPQAAPPADPTAEAAAPQEEASQAEEAPEEDDMAALVSALVAELSGLKGRIEALEAIAASPAPAPDAGSTMLADVAKGLGLSDVTVKAVKAAAGTDAQAALGLLLAEAKAAQKPTTSGYTQTRTAAEAPKTGAPQSKREIFAACLAECGHDAIKAQALYAERTRNL